MSVIENADPATAEALHKQGQRVEQSLRQRGYIAQPSPSQNYTDAQIDAVVQEFVDQAVDIGYTGAAPLPTGSTVVTDGSTYTVPVTGTYVSTVTVTVVDGTLTAIALG